MTGRLAGKVALVSGGGSTKGLALIRTLTREGARVVVGDINKEGGERNATELGPDLARFTPLDVTREDSWSAATAFALDAFGKLDILINSARAHIRNSDLATISLENWRDQTAVNLDGAFLGMKHVLPVMRDGSGGSIVNVVSLSSIAPFAPAPAFSASHAALLNLTKTTAVNCARAGENIRVNAVVCGMSSNSPLGDVFDLARRIIPLGRPAYADDIADAILWLVSEDSKYITGNSVTLDGGFTADGIPGG